MRTAEVPVLEQGDQRVLGTQRVLTLGHGVSEWPTQAPS
jgi:hypothetical protein